MSLDWARSVVHPRHAGAWREGPLALLLAASKDYIQTYILIYLCVYTIFNEAVVFNSQICGI